MERVESSTGLTPRVGASMAYTGWWVTGLILWFVERRDPFVRFHAAQSVTAFGALALLIGALSALALLSLSFAPAAFDLLVIAAQIVVTFAVVLWAVTLYRVAGGHEWRIPIADRWAEKMVCGSWIVDRGSR